SILATPSTARPYGRVGSPNHPPPFPTRRNENLILKAIEIAKPGDIIIVAGNANPTTACWGGVMSAMAQSRGVKGLITDGMIRDVSDCRELKFPIWATGVTPIAPNSDIPP